MKNINSSKVKILKRTMEKVIGSAETVAFLRAVCARIDDEDIRNPDTLAEQFLTSLKWRIRVKFPKLSMKVMDKFNPGSYGYLIARTRHIDKLLLDAVQGDFKQLVILGAGNDSRAYRFGDELNGVEIFELDFPGTQYQKKKQLTKIFGYLPSHVTYVPIDFNSQLLEEALIPRRYNKNLKTFFIWEGVSCFLTEESVDCILTFVSKNSATGSSIVFDYSSRSFVEGDRSTFGARELEKWYTRIGEPYLFGLNEGEIADFLNQRDFKVISDLGSAELESQYLTKHNGTIFTPMLGNFRMVYASVKNQKSEEYLNCKNVK